jgi:hypothetical protein
MIIDTLFSDPPEPTIAKRGQEIWGKSVETPLRFSETLLSCHPRFRFPILELCTIADLESAVRTPRKITPLSDFMGYFAPLELLGAYCLRRGI